MIHFRGVKITRSFLPVPKILRHGPGVSILPAEEYRDLAVEVACGKFGPKATAWVKERDEYEARQ